MANDLIAINDELTRLTQALRVAVGGFEKHVKDAADLRTTYDVQWAQAMLSSNSDDTQKVREAHATIVCQTAMRDARVAEATRDAFKVRARAIETVISIQQSRIRVMNETEPSGF